jgi:hypothetical protein
MYGQTGRSLGQPDHPGEKSDLTEAWVPGALSLSLSPVAHVRTDPGYDDHRRCRRGPRGSVYTRARGHNASSWLPYPARASSIRRIRQANLPRARRETGDVVPAGSLVPPSIIGFFCRDFQLSPRDLLFAGHHRIAWFVFSRIRHPTQSK